MIRREDFSNSPISNEIGFLGEYCFNQPFLSYSSVPMESTIFISAIESRGITVANRQAAIEIIAASAIAATGTETSCKVSVCAAPTKMQQI